MMTAEERVRILREAKPNSWVAFSGDESKVVAYGKTYSDAVKAAEKLGESDPVMVKIPDNWSSRVFSLSR
jgi:D-serine dehydratase